MAGQEEVMRLVAELQDNQLLNFAGSCWPPSPWLLMRSSSPPIGSNGGGDT
jgi:hypothetical protein